MIQRLLLLCLLILSISCSEDNKNSYTINGSAKGITDGTEVILQELVNNRPAPKDTTEVANEKFSFNGVAESTEMHFISIKNIQGNLPFILENGTIDIIIDPANLNKSVLKGTKENELFGSYTARLLAVSQNNQELSNHFREAQNVGDEAKMLHLRTSFDSLRNAQAAFELDFIKANNNTFVGVLVLERLIFSQGQDPVVLNELYESLPVELKNSKSGKNIEKYLKPMIATAEGAMAPDFEAPNPEGKMLALKDIKGKVTIVDFWAAWCGPCRRENPNLVRIYEKYHDKGLEIVGVSLDGNSKQQDPKAAWIKAIADDGLTWHQVSNLKYFRDPIAEAYSIKAIPATFVLDEDGRIIGKELRGQALENKIAELLQ